MQYKVFLFEAIQRANAQEASMINEDANALNALTQIFDGDGSNILSKDKLLSIFSTPLRLNEAQVSEIESKMAQCLARTSPVSVDKIRSFEESSLSSDSLALQVTRALIMVHYIQKQKIEMADAHEEQKIDKDDILLIIKGVETILAQLFKALTKTLIDQQMQSISQAIGGGNQDGNLLTKYNQVLTANGSLAACTQLISIFLCTNGAFEGCLHTISASLSACSAFCQLEAKINGDTDLKKTLQALSSLFAFANGAVAYRVFRETKDIVGDNPLLELTS